ncbi:energy-coupling factor transport system ATP-binding protein [Nocardioides albertanoniae]|uniref:Energy-coupling factor transport system ATP-binding protein n=1 Tax=Nocardioides albertanoniae TaxID=1175486 RepID=A0A543AAA5_9ACTN|nr:ABC transporter ATP-binding protein [Nocardioides albertanoniae]TQL69531.1 energy-coupling factor transport system ATP-binding protein [Nocardioides albertanoniae]
MIELRGITFTPPDSSEHVLKDVDLTIEEGELLVVSGPTGSGKSTLLGVVAGLVPRFSGGELDGDLLLEGVSFIRTPPRERAGTIGYVGQDPVAGFVTDTVEEELAYGMEQLGLPPATMRRRVEETLDLLGIADLRQRSLRELSGGQQQRVAIGSVLTTHPRVVVLDEPTSALDPTAAEDVLATITRLVHDLGTSVVLAEHRLERVVPFADRIALLVGDGSLTVGEPADILETSPVAPPLVEVGRALGWSPLPLTVRDARRKARGVALADRVGLDTPPPSGSAGSTSGVVGRAVSASERVETNTVALSARSLTVTRGRTPVLHDVSIELPAGRVTALMGRNGSGKSTLLWTLQGTQKRLAGAVSVEGRDPAALDADARRALVGLLPQTAADLLYLETVAEECEAGGPRTRDILDRLVPGIPDDQHPRDLSEGQRLGLALALILSADPPVLLLDEPTRGLDYAAKRALCEILRDLTGAGKAVLVATHDVEFVAEAADDVVVLADGEVVSAGDVRSVTAESPAFAPQVSKVFGPGWLNVREVVEAVTGE